MNLDKWTSGAAYDQWMGRWSRLVADQFLLWLNLPHHLRWLDVCCGSGMLSEAVVEHCAPANVTGIDASPQQIEFARANRSSDNVIFEVGDAMALPFGEASFDVVVCGLGLNYLPDPQRALEEMRRAVVSQGIVAIYVWDYAEGARFLRQFWDAAASVDAEAVQHDQANRFSDCNSQSLRQLFEAAALRQVTVAALDVITRFPSFDDYWQPLLTGQGSAPNYLASRNQSMQAAIREALQRSLPAALDGAIELPARAWAVSGRKFL